MEMAAWVTTPKVLRLCCWTLFCYLDSNVTGMHINVALHLPSLLLTVIKSLKDLKAGHLGAI